MAICFEEGQKEQLIQTFGQYLLSRCKVQVIHKYIIQDPTTRQGNRFDLVCIKDMGKNHK